MTQEYLKWLGDRIAFFDDLAARQRALKEPTATVNAAYARAFRSALAHVTEDETNPQPTAAP